MAWLRVVTTATALLVCAGCAAAPSAPEQAIPALGPTAAPVRPADVDANELGLIPVLMYHRLVADPKSIYDRTPEDFRAELERLATENYVPITTAELAAGRIDIPAGKHPVVLTFDDGDPTTMALGADGDVAPGTAVQILLDVARSHPDFRPVASMYVNADPYGGGESGNRALRWLHEHGFEIGNHTYDHTNLRSASPEDAREAIVSGDRFIRDAVPGYQPTTLALPFGARPRNPALALRGTGYEYTGVLLVGANPAPSPFSDDFDPQGIPRIRSQGPDGAEAEYGSATWLDELASNPKTRYTSDGNPDVIAYPAGSGSPADGFAASVVAY